MLEAAAVLIALLTLIVGGIPIWMQFNARQIKVRGQCGGNFDASKSFVCLNVSAWNTGERVATIHSICIGKAAGECVSLGEYAELSPMSKPLPFKLLPGERADWIFFDLAPVVRNIVDNKVKTKRGVKSLECILCNPGGEKISSFYPGEGLIQTICRELETKK